MKRVFIAGAQRTAIGKFGGALASVPAYELGGTLIKALISQNQLAANCIDEVILGHVLTAGCGQNPARQAALFAGLADTTPALTINKVCGSGMKALHIAVQAIRNDDAQLIIAGGQENMSLSPHTIPMSRNGHKMGNFSVVDTMINDGLWDAFHDYHMGITAENLAERYALTREAQDEFALMSQQRAAKAQNDGAFDNEIVGIEVKHRKSSVLFNKDEFIRHDINAEALDKLRPAFKPDGTVTAGNASGINDGAAALLVASEEAIEAFGLTPLVEVKAHASAGVAPEIMGIGPVPATNRCLEKAGWQVDDLDLIEANEAFAAQSLAVSRDLGWALEKVNVRGGAIALGHPIGASGARVIVTLIHAMQAHAAQKGLATLCIGGGQGVATAFELVSQNNVG